MIMYSSFQTSTATLNIQHYNPHSKKNKQRSRPQVSSEPRGEIARSGAVGSLTTSASEITRLDSATDSRVIPPIRTLTGPAASTTGSLRSETVLHFDHDGQYPNYQDEPFNAVSQEKVVTEICEPRRSLEDAYQLVFATNDPPPQAVDEHDGRPGRYWNDDGCECHRGDARLPQQTLESLKSSASLATASLPAGHEAQLTEPADRALLSPTTLSSVSNPKSSDAEVTAPPVIYGADVSDNELPHVRFSQDASEMPLCCDGKQQMQAGVGNLELPDTESSEWWLEDARNNAQSGRAPSCNIPQASVEPFIDTNSRVARSSTPPSGGIQHFQSMAESSPRSLPAAAASSASFRILHSAHGAYTTPGPYEVEGKSEDDDEEDEPPRRPLRRRKHAPTTPGDITHTFGDSMARGQNSCETISQQEKVPRRRVTRSPSISSDVSHNGTRLRESEAAQPNFRTTRVFERRVRAKRSVQRATLPNNKVTSPMQKSIFPAPRRQRGRPRRSQSLAASKSRNTKNKPKSEKHPRYLIKAIIGTEVHEGVKYAVVSWEDTLEPLDVIKAEAPLAWEEFCI